MSASAPIFPRAKSAASQYGTAFFFIAGLLPVTSIAFHCAGFLSITTALLFVILPAFALAFVLNIFNRDTMRLVFRGWISGIVAVTLYDLVRIPFIYAGWDDFIPHIATWLTGSNDHAYLISYTWRYAGNGGGLGIVFFLIANHFGLRKYIVSCGVNFGLLIFAGLLALLVFFPRSQELMFEVTPIAFFGGLTGHVVYGYVLGRLAKRMV